MSRIIAVKDNGHYTACTLKFDKPEVPRLLDMNYAVGSSAKFLVATGDVVGLTQSSALRSIKSRAPRRYKAIDELIAAAKEEGIHRISIRDKAHDVMEDIGEWNMECRPEDELFVENISNDRCWHHLIDSEIIHQISNS